MKNNQNVILLNNLFNGEYIKEKVGGEIINMYQSDNDKYYVYVNPYGNIETKWDNKIKYILFIRSVGNGFVKVIGKAVIEEQICLDRVFRKGSNEIDAVQKSYIEKNSIEYGGASIFNLGSWSRYYVTFKAEGVYKPKSDIYLTSRDESENDNLYILKKVGKINNQSQKLYIKPGNLNYQVLNTIINKNELWEGNPVGKVNLSQADEHNKSFLSIIKKEKDELVNSNLLAHFLESDKNFWSNFAIKVLKISEENIINSAPKITRESVGNIDLLIEAGQCLIVIENKIKSGINGLRDNGYSQLEKYIEKAEEFLNNPLMNESIKYYILRPNYNNENFEDFNQGFRYTEIKYSQIVTTQDQK